jgi:hypothetical protein
MANDIGSLKSVSGSSMNLNTQRGEGGMKPVPTSGTASPGGTKPPKAEECHVPMPK